jgi:hypothetical protein
MMEVEAMFIIDKDSVTATKEKVEQGKIPQAIDDVKKMLDIKEAHLWRSEAIAPCCGSLSGYTCQINSEVQILENTLTALESSDKTQAANLLEEYIHTVDENHKREPCEPQYI